MTEAFSIAILFTSIALAAYYFRNVRGNDRSTMNVIGGHRPWRKIGAAICLLVGVMFVLGIFNLDASRSPKSFIFYWTIVLLLILWLCALAVRDLMHTRATIARWRAGKARLDGTPIEPKADAKESES